MIEIDTAEIDALFDRFGRSLDGREVRTVVRRTFAHEGRKGRTAVKRSLVAQTGLKSARVHKTLTIRATDSEFRITGRDGFTSLTEFGARKTKAGVVASPWGRRTTFKGTFLAYGGSNVFRREGPERGPLERLYGPAIPIEMLRDETRDAFETRVAAGFMTRLEHELGRVLAGF